MTVRKAALKLLDILGEGYTHHIPPGRSNVCPICQAAVALRKALDEEYAPRVYPNDYE